MDFLKKNYEKIVLIGLFVIFILVLLYLLTIVKRTKEIKDDDLAIPTRKADYKVAKADGDEFNFDALFTTNIIWDKSEARNLKNRKAFSDLLQMFEAVRCGHDACGKIIPYFVILEGANCPICGQALIKFVPEAVVAGVKGGKNQDSDRDGIPDMTEVEIGLDPYNATDAREDLDGDGFINVYEYQMKTDIHDPKSHPPYHVALSVNRLERQPLKVLLKNVSEIDPNNKKSWTIQLLTEKMRVDGKWQNERNHFLTLGEKIKVENSVYTIKDVTFDEVEKIVDNKPTMVRVYKVTMIDPQNREVVMTNDAIVYDPDDKVFFDYIFGDGRELTGSIGTTLKLGSNTTGFTTYKIKGIDKDPRNTTVTLIDTAAEDKDIVITKTPAMPEEMMLNRRNTADDGNRMNMDGGPRPLNQTVRPQVPIYNRPQQRRN